MLTVDQQEKQLGTLIYGKTHDFTYTIVNSSNKNITIVKVVVGCGSCTKASINKNRLIPGEAATVNVAFTPGSNGLNNKNISIAYDAEGMPGNIQLKFKANVVSG